MPKLDQRGAIHLIILIVLIIGIIAGLYLVQHPEVFRPKAGGGNIRFVHTEENSASCVTNQNNKEVAVCPTIKFEILVPQNESN